MAGCYSVDVKWAKYFLLASVVREITYEQNVEDGYHCNNFSL